MTIYANYKTGESLDTEMSPEVALELLPKENNFAMSLKQQFIEKHGRVSETQLYWIMKIAAEQKKIFPCDTTEILEFVNTDKVYIKYKALNINMVIYPNGSIWLNGSRIGQYTEKGLYAAGDLDPTVLHKFLLYFTKNGFVDSLCRIGAKTGICCFCGRELTNRFSRELGRGPICSEKRGLSFPYAEYEASLKKEREGE